MFSTCYIVISVLVRGDGRHEVGWMGGAHLLGCLLVVNCVWIARTEYTYLHCYRSVAMPLPSVVQAWRTEYGVCNHTELATPLHHRGVVDVDAHNTDVCTCTDTYTHPHARPYHGECGGSGTGHRGQVLMYVYLLNAGDGLGLGLVGSPLMRLYVPVCIY